MSNNINRRDFIKSTAVAGLGITMTRNIRLLRKDDRKVRLGFIGVGSHGISLLRTSLNMDDVEVPAICDIDIDHLSRAQRLVERSGRKKPEGYSRGEEDFRRMVIRDDLDGVIIATPWEWHVPMAVATMKAGKYAAPEVPGAYTIEGCWELVNTSESTGMPCMMLENHCYDRDSMAILNMVRQGLFGELMHCECGYQNDMRIAKFEPNGELRWIGKHSVERNGDLYPTHGIGPIANCLDIDRGNRFVYLTSTATKSRGLNYYAAKKFGPDHPNAKRKYALGDIVTSVIKCYNGETITINHDTDSSRPYSNMYRIQGTKGLWMEDNMSIYLEDRSPKERTWEPFDKYQIEFENPLWKIHLVRAKKFGHGGADYLKTRAFIECIKRKIPIPIDVYDTVSWSVITPLSEQSIANGSAPVEFPDFTRGKWKTNKPIFGLTDEY